MIKIRTIIVDDEPLARKGIRKLLEEEENIEIVYQELKKVCSQLVDRYSSEIIFVNDGSRDTSWSVIKKICQLDQNVKGLNFVRNFGHQNALKSGYDWAKGDLVITMDTDMQDPPLLALDMIQKWEEGYDVVYARRINRNDGFFKKLTAFWYYKLLSMISEFDQPRNVGDFRLVDKNVVVEVRKAKEKNLYLRGLIAWFGFSHAFVDFKRPNRLHGTTGYSWPTMIRFALDGITGFSIFPLRISGYLGTLILFCTLFLFPFSWLGISMNFSPFTTTFSIYFFMGIQFLMLWIMGEYIRRIYEYEKGRPLYILKEVLNDGKNEYEKSSRYRSSRIFR